jgi:hypothetical protein
MASYLFKANLRSFLSINKISIVFNRLININKRDTITKNEQEWIEESSKKILEKAKCKQNQ